ncbi:hypothetical protein D3C84_1201150 [compost metagenome]
MRIIFLIGSIYVSRRNQPFLAQLFKFLGPLQIGCLIDVKVTVICNDLPLAFSVLVG